MKWKLRYFLYAIGMMLIPFGLDKLAGVGLLKMIMSKTHFDASTWFTFWGSYLPGIIFGLIALYNTQLVREQQRIIDQLHERNRIRIGRGANFYRYDKDERKIGSYSINELVSSFSEIKEPAGTRYEDGYLIEFCIIDSIEKLEIKSADLKDIRIDFGDKHNVEPMLKKCWKKEIPNHLALYWLFDETNKKDFALFLDNVSRNNPDLEVTKIKLMMELTLVDEESFEVVMGFNVKCNITTGAPKVVDSWCYVEKG